MELKLKPLDEQVVVITGASSGIGLATAQDAAEAGAKLVLAARSEKRLSEIVDSINEKRGEAPRGGHAADARPARRPVARKRRRPHLRTPAGRLKAARTTARRRA